MATVNEIVTKYRTSGSDKVVKDTQKIGKAQTRLGQNAASAGRQFSAQATGLGGLVSAYAGAAATVFALQQAFAALNAAARAEQTIAGVNALATAIGESGPKVLARLQEITNGQLSLVQSAELANIALSSGFSTEQIEGLTQVGVKASRALGRDLTDSVQRLLRGVSKLEPELLDELGIFTRIEPAAEAFAASIGKVASSLTAFEKRQAFANAAITEGNNKFGDVDSEAETAAASLEKLVATLSDIATAAGQLIANVIQPLVDALGAPVTAIATFGILAKTVFGTAIRELGKSADEFTDRARFLGDTVTEKLEKTFGSAGKQAAQLTAETQKLNLASTRASVANKEEFNTLIKKARAQEITFGEVRRLNQIAKEEELLNKRKIDQLKQLENRTKAQETAITRLTARQKAFNRTVTITETRLKATNRALRGASVGVRGLALALGFAGKFVSGLLGKLTTFITFASIIAAVGSAILDAFGFLEPISKFIDDLLRRAAVVLGITKEAREQSRIREMAPDLGGQITTTTGRRNRRVTSTQDLGASAVRVIAEATGQSFKQVIKQIEVAQDGAVKLKAAIDLTGPLSRARIIFRDTSKLTGESLANANKENELQVNRVQSLQVAAKLQEALVSGSATLEQIEKRRGAIVAKIANLRKEEDDRNKETADLLQKELDILNFNAEAQIAILTARKKLRSEFSAQIKAADNLNKFFTLENELNIEGLRISQSQEDLQRSRIAQLQRSFALGKKALEQQRAGKELTSEIAKQLAMLARDAEKALLGSFVKSFEAAKKLDERLGKILEKEGKRLTVAKQQLAVFKAQNAIKDLDRETKALTDQIKRTNDLAKANEKLRVARLKNIEVVRESERKLTEELIKMNPFLSEGDKRDLVLKLERESLKRLEDSIKEQKEALIANQKAEAEILKAQIQQQKDLLFANSPQATAGLLKQRFDAEKKLQLDKIAADEKAQLKDIELIEERNKLLIKELENFMFHVDGMAQVLANDIVQRKMLAFAAKDERTGRKEGTALRQNIRTELDMLLRTDRGTATRIMGDAGIGGGPGGRVDREALKSITNVEKLRKILFQIERSKVTTQLTKQLESLKKELDAKDFETIRKAVKDVADANRELAENQSDAKLIAAQAAATKKLNDLQTKLKISGINLETALTNLDTSLVSTKNKVDNLAITTKKANDTFSNGIRAIGDVLRGQFTAGLTELNDALINGTLNAKNFKEGLTDFLGETAKKVQQAFFQETIAKPVSDFLTKEVGNLFGVDMSGGINDVKLEAGNLPVVEKGGKGIVNSFTEKAESSFKTIGEKLSSFKDQAVEAFSGLGSNIVDIFKNIGSSVMSVFSGSSGGNILSGLSGFASAGPFDTTAIGPESFLASGGKVRRMAAGGMNRDRVPALLEPGEFVMKRSSARSIGEANLQSMNSTGQMGGNVSVNIVNQGTPQEATQQSQPRFDGEKFVIDIVTRDLRNNGPIRKSLRGSS